METTNYSPVIGYHVNERIGKHINTHMFGLLFWVITELESVAHYPFNGLWAGVPLSKAPNPHCCPGAASPLLLCVFTTGV